MQLSLNYSPIFSFVQINKPTGPVSQEWSVLANSEIYAHTYDPGFGPFGFDRTHQDREIQKTGC